MKFNFIIAICVLTFFSIPTIKTLSFSQEHKNIYTPINPDANWQSAIKKVMLSEDISQFFTASGKLMGMSKDKNHKTLLQQILYFGVYSDMAQADFFTLKLMKHLAISEMYIATALVPQLMDKNENIRKLVEIMLVYVDKRSRKSKPDYSYYRQLLNHYKHADQILAKELSQLMFKIHPNEALKIVGSHYSDRVKRKKNNFLSYLVSKCILEYEYNKKIEPKALFQTKTELKKMLNDGNWWEKMYVNSVYKKYKFLR